MAATWLLLVTAAAVLVSMVVLAAACLRCRTTAPLVSIRQTNSEESTEFRVIHHPSETTVDCNPAHLPSNLLSPYSPSGDPGFQRRHRSFTPTEAGDIHSSFSESNPSYENAAEEPDSTHESDAEDTGYIIVLPGGEAPLTNQSRASTPSSDVRHDYENVPNKKEDREYLNVDPADVQRPAPGESSQSDTDDDDDGNYVNVNDGTRIDL